MDRRTVACLAIDTLNSLGFWGKFARMARHATGFQKLKIGWVLGRVGEGFVTVPEGLDDSLRIGI